MPRRQTFPAGDGAETAAMKRSRGNSKITGCSRKRQIPERKERCVCEQGVSDSRERSVDVFIYLHTVYAANPFTGFTSAVDSAVQM